MFTVSVHLEDMVYCNCAVLVICLDDFLDYVLDLLVSFTLFFSLY
jgi:hypothetical protein